MDAAKTVFLNGLGQGLPGKVAWRILNETLYQCFTTLLRGTSTRLTLPLFFALYGLVSLCSHRALLLGR